MFSRTDHKYAVYYDYRSISKCTSKNKTQIQGRIVNLRLHYWRIFWQRTAKYKIAELRKIWEKFQKAGCPL